MIDRVGQQVGNYQLMRLLGQGGFAEVYLGQHVYLGTQAAIKLLYGRMASQDIENFIREAQIIAALKHPHILRILDFGMVQNVLPYLVMEYIPYGTLRQLHPEGTMVPLSLIIDYVKQVASALDYLHAARLIHRDVKPENMLLNDEGHIVLGDFGLAAIAHSLSSMRTLDNAGTVDYMAPEHMKKKPRPSSDQYALATVVYEWLCGYRPFYGDSFVEVAMSKFSQDPAPLLGRVPDLPDQVELVVMKALSREADQRFQTVTEFANLLELASKSALPASFVLSMTPPLPVVSNQPHYPSHRDVQSVMTPHLADQPQTVQNGPVAPWTQMARPLANHTVAHHQFQSPLPQPRSPMPDLVPPEPIPPAPQDAPVQSRIYDEAYNAYAAYNNDATAAENPVVREHPLTHYEQSPVAPAAQFSPAPLPEYDAVPASQLPPVAQAFPTLPLGGAQEVEDVLRAPTAPLMPAIPPEMAYPLEPFYQAPVRPPAVVLAQRQVATRRSVSPGTLCYAHNGHSDVVNAVSWSPNGQYVASGSDDQTIQVWDVVSGEQKVHLLYVDPLVGGAHSSSPMAGSYVLTVAWSPDGTRLTMGGGNRMVLVWSVLTGETIGRYEGHGGAVYTTAWSPDGTRVASGSWDNTVQIWDAVQGVPIMLQGQPASEGASLTGNDNSPGVRTVSWSPNGRWIASGKQEMVQVWDAVTGDLICTYCGHASFVYSVAWSPDGSRIASASADETVHIWNALTGHQLLQYRQHPDAVKVVAWSPDGTRVASGSWDHTVQVWDALSGRTVYTYRGHVGAIYSLAWSPDGSYIASCGEDKTVQIWRAR